MGAQPAADWGDSPAKSSHAPCPTISPAYRHHFLKLYFGPMSYCPSTFSSLWQPLPVMRD